MGNNFILSIAKTWLTFYLGSLMMKKDATVFFALKSVKSNAASLKVVLAVEVDCVVFETVCGVAQVV